MAPPTADPDTTPWFRDLDTGSGAATALSPALRHLLRLATKEAATEQAAVLLEQQQVVREAERKEADRQEQARRAEQRAMREAAQRSIVAGAWTAWWKRMLVFGALTAGALPFAGASTAIPALPQITPSMTFEGWALNETSAAGHLASDFYTLTGVTVIACLTVLLASDLALGRPARRIRFWSVFLGMVLGLVVFVWQWLHDVLSNASWVITPGVMTISYLACAVTTGVRVRLRAGEALTPNEVRFGPS